MAKKRLFTYSLTCTFQMQFTFDESQVELENGDEEEPGPSAGALEELANELRQFIRQDYAVDSMEIADDGFGCVLLGVSEVDD